MYFSNYRNSAARKNENSSQDFLTNSLIYVI